MDRILAFDYGDKRIGVAMSDPLKIIASELCVIENRSKEYVYAEVKKIVDEKNIKTVVVGLPYNMDHTIGPQAQKCIDFGEDIKRMGIEIVYVDERRSSMKVKEAMHSINVNKKKYVATLDAKAACVILQEYLN